MSHENPNRCGSQATRRGCNRSGGPIWERQARSKVIYCRALSPTTTERIARMNKAHVDAIASRHAALHAIIAEEEHRPHPDMDLLHRLKKEKLRLKDTLTGH